MVAAFRILKGQRVVVTDFDGHREAGKVLCVTFTPYGEPRIRVQLDSGRVCLSLPKNVEAAQ